MSFLKALNKLVERDGNKRHSWGKIPILVQVPIRFINYLNSIVAITFVIYVEVIS